MTELALSALEPALQSLYDRLDAAHRTSPNGDVPLDGTTLGTDGGAILAVLPEAFVTPSVTFQGDGLTLDSDPVAQTITLAGTCSGSALGLDQPSLQAIFSLDPATGALAMTMTIGADDGWSLDQSFPLLAQTWFSNIRYVQDTTPPPCLVLTSLADAQRRYAKGLNVRGSLQTAQWPLNALPQLISGVLPTLQTTGSAESVHGDQQSVESLVITTPLPDFSLPATILPALDFRGNRLALYAKYSVTTNQQDLVTDQSIDLCAQSEVTVNGVALPLAVYLPVPGANWGVGLVPGARVPIGQLADFLAGFTGVSLGTALPDAVRALNVFELRTMLVRLNSDRTGFSSFSLALGTVPADASGSVWKIIDGVIELHALDFNLNVVRDKQGALQTSGFIQGVVNLGASLQVGANIALPIGQGPWTFSARSTQPINALDAIGGLFGSNDLAQSLPAGLGALASYVLQNLSFTFDPVQGQLTRANLAIATAQPWAIVTDQLVLESLYLDLTVDHPRQAGISPYGEVGGALQIGSVYLTAEVTCDGPGSPWLITVSAAPVPLPSLADMTRLLAGQRVADALPDTLAGNSFSLFGVSVSANLTTRKVQQVTFGLTTTGSWTVIADILVVNGVETYFEFDWTGTDGALAISGYISGSVAFIGSNFMLSATKRAGGWDLSAQLDTSTPFTLQNGITRFGSADLWNSVAALGVPNVSVTRGGLTYATDTRDYALQATVDFSDPNQNLPWTVSIGVTSLTIRSLGADITAVRASNGTATDKKICVTGAFDIGSVGFKVLYDTSKGVVVDCTLVSADHPVSARDIAKSLLGDNAVTGIEYTSGFMPLDQILFSDVHAQLVVGTGNNTSSFQLYGTITVQGAKVNAVLAIQRDAAVGWGFVVGIKVDSQWSLPGFTDVLGSFNFDKQTWLVAVSSFNSPNFAYPAAFNLPDYKGALKYLNFYASFSTSNTNPAVGGVTKLLPSKTLPPSLTVTGLVADKLADSWLKCTLYTDADGVPIFGWDTMRLISVDFVISGKPALALQAVFLYKGIYNVDPNTKQKNYLRLQLSTGVTSTYAFIIASGVNGQPIFTWNDALGLDGFTVQLDWIKLGLVFTGLGIEGGFEGMVSFSNPPRQDTVPTLMRNVRPHPAEVAETRGRMRRLRAVRACGPVTLDAGNPAIPGVPTDLTAFCAEHQPPVDDAVYERAFDPDQIMVKMLAVVAVTAASEGVPVPRQLGAHIVNVTIPYLLKQFVHIDVPSIIQPIQLPDVCFYIAIGDSPSVFEFYFHGVIVIFHWRGEVEALFQLPHIRFSARMDPILIGPSANDPLIVLAKASNDLAHGPDILVDSQPPSGQPMIRGHLYGSFLKLFNFEADIEVSAGPPPLIHFSVAQNLGSLLNYHLTFTYRDLLYIHADGGFTINLSTQQGADSISGFSVTKNGQPYRMADHIDLTRVQTATANAVGLMMSANTVFTLDASPNHPVFQLQFRSDFDVDLGARCHITCHLNFDYNVDSNTLERLPAIIISQLGSNAAQVFGALVQTAECFAWFLEQGLLVLLNAADAARALVGVFAVAIDRFVDLLNTLGNGLDTLSNWLWDIFGSHDSERNTRALRDNTDNRYSSSQVAGAVKQTQDTKQPSNPYTASALMRDQANAGYSSSDALRALIHVFSQYAPGDMAVAAGRLAADPTLTGYTPGAVAVALKANYGNAVGTAAQMRAVLAQVYTGAASLNAQQMANALAAAGYPMGDVAKVLHDNYAPDVPTAAAMAAILTLAYQSAPPGPDVLAAALAPFYDAPPVAKTVFDHFQGTYQNQPGAMATTLIGAYTAAGKPLTVQVLLSALAGCGYTAVQSAPVAHQHYPQQTATAQAMSALLLQAWTTLAVGDMTAALVACQYDATDIGRALQQHYGVDVGTPQQMAALFAAHGVALAQTAKALKALYSASIADASAMVALLNAAYANPPPTAQAMATALAGAPYAPAESAPALKRAYPTDTATATLMAALLRAAYGDSALTAAIMAQALAASPFAAPDTAGVLRADYPTESQTVALLAGLLKNAPYPAAANAAALRQSFPQDTQHADQLAPVLAGVGYALNDVAPVLKSSYPTEAGTAAQMFTILSAAFTQPAPTAATMAAALAVSPFPPVEAAPVLKTHYAGATATAADMYALLNSAYQAPAPTAQEMAGALAGSPYVVADVAPLLRTHYPADAGTAPKLAAMLKAAYQGLALADCLNGLAHASFSAYDGAAAMPALYHPLPEANLFAAALDAGYTGPAALSGVQIGVGLASAAYDAVGQSKGIRAVRADTSAGLMAAYLIALSDTTMAPALTAADNSRLAGDALNVAATKTAAAVSTVNGEILCLALNSTYAPPNQSMPALCTACAGALSTQAAAAVATGLLLTAPATTPAPLLDTLTAGFSAAGKALDPQTAGAAVASAFAAIGAAPSQSALVGLMLAKYGAQATPALLAHLLIQAYGTAATVDSVIGALAGGYAQAGLTLGAVVAAVAVQQSFSLSAKDTAPTLTALGQAFSLTRVPNDVAALGAAMSAAQFDLSGVSAAMRVFYGSHWTVPAYALLSEVYSQPIFQTAIQRAGAGMTVQQAGPSLKGQYGGTSATEMVHVLASAFTLVATATGVVPVAQAMKAAGYTLVDTAAAMRTQYLPDWTVADYQKVSQVFTQS
ncbi:hemagglutinin [Ralstonia solanacearum]|uniref:hemagglutinin n=1 Tax=Ralstonia solanacearum TaxID=305 RepID=UPI00078B39EA|nr:hemagglutinin [Ralstonia solanacearum]AMP40463.1 hemagglutinin [Ralstonia solanacearum]AXV89321.1 hemagglutinin [Ralstonia solanacearum]AXW08783.1 hemagglutinin [Ralstonia solanacearum]AXW26567.1 hemagglutinin [Ralstonia solanacearum]AXW83483.1 hemagglutinin [Ralstonia solanacearum]